MADGLGGASYSYNSLSRMTSETRYFSPLGQYFTLSYDYNLAGELKTFTSPFGETVNYSFDNTGRPTGITGSGFGSVSTFASNMQYRAWGTMKSATIGSGIVESGVTTPTCK